MKEVPPGINPAFIAEIEEGQRLRGWITNAYAQIEFLLGDLILRCTSMPEYRHLPQTLPHGATDRIKRVRCILNSPGPLEPFATSLQALLAEFEKGHETRNLLAHGFCEFLVTPDGDTGIQFQKWHRHERRQDARLIRCFRLQDLEREEKSFAALAQSGLVLFRQVHDSFGWTARPDK